jgi:hypothetical protein
MLNDPDNKPGGVPTVPDFVRNVCKRLGTLRALPTSYLDAIVMSKVGLTEWNAFFSHQFNVKGTSEGYAPSNIEA